MAGLDGLCSLGFSGTRTHASLEILARMATLESIELWQTAGVTDAGIGAHSRGCRACAS